MNSGTQLTPYETAFVQTFEGCKITFNILKHFSDECAKNPTNRHIMVNLQYSMKYIYEQLERMQKEWAYYQARKDPTTPLNSTIRGGLTAEEAIAEMKKRHAK